MNPTQQYLEEALSLLQQKGYTLSKRGLPEPPTLESSAELLAAARRVTEAGYTLYVRTLVDPPPPSVPFHRVEVGGLFWLPGDSTVWVKVDTVRYLPQDPVRSRRMLPVTVPRDQMVVPVPVLSPSRR